jgi:diguanylate cyclase (GGDEF)-like protein
MLRDFRHFTPRVFWLVTLASAAVLMAVIVIPQWLSGRARLEVMRTHVAQTARLAASVVDGDLHRRLLEPANYTAELYTQVVAPLVEFHSSAPDVFYVYTMVEREGRTYFIVDTAASTRLVSKHKLQPSAYMEPFRELQPAADPDWLARVARGETYVYPGFQRDDYGVFLSGHAPIYDSEGRYSGFVGVDYDIGYYLAQESSFRSIFIGTSLAALLLAALIGYLAARHDYTLGMRLAEQHRLSEHDELTGLLNRRGALAAAREALALSAASYAAILVDVDDLKGINDTHGHAGGDEFLVKVADAMRTSVREKDVCARLGGDEFLVFATGCDLDAATEIARRILSKVYASDSARGAHFGVSIGVCVSPRAEADFDALYRRADQALYRAKAAGRNRYVVFDPLAA